MTRRDFQLLSRILYQQHAPESLARAMADELRHTNPRFDYERFVRAATEGR